MPHNPKLSTIGANAMIDGLTPLLDSGYLRVYDGVQPASTDVAVSTQTLLATLRFGATAFTAAAGAGAGANAITSDTNAAANGTPTWFRALESDGTTVVFDGSVSVLPDTSGDLVLDLGGSPTVIAGSSVQAASAQLTQSRG